MNSYRSSGWLFLSVVLLLLSANAALFLINDDDVLRLYAFNGLLVSIGAIYVPAVLFLRGKPEHSHGRAPISFKQVLLSFALGWGVFLLNVVISVLTGMFTEWLGMPPADVSMPRMGGWRTLSAVFLICILPAITEETLFRGVLLHEWKALGKRKAVALTTALFALVHFQPDAMPSVLFIGCILALTAWNTGSVYTSMIVHFTNNLAVLWLSFGDTGGAQPRASAGDMTLILILYAVAGAAVTYASYKRLKAMSLYKPEETASLEKGDAARLVLPLGISALLLLWLNALAVYLRLGGSL